MSSCLKEESFDIVSTGASIAYSKNPERTVKKLIGMVKPGGYFLNLEMNNQFFGELISSMYDYPFLSLGDVPGIIKDEGCSLDVVPLGFKNFPVNLTRVFHVVRKPYVSQ